MKILILISLLFLFISCKKKTSEQNIIAIQNNNIQEKDMKDHDINNCLYLTKEEVKDIKKISEDGLYKNTKTTDSQFINMLSYLEKIDKFPIVLKSEAIDKQAICDQKIQRIANFYFFNLQEMREINKEIGYSGLHVLSSENKILKAYEILRLPDKDNVKLILFKTASQIFDDSFEQLYTVWVLCSFVNNEIIDFANISSTKFLEQDQIRTTVATIEHNFRVFIKMYNLENDLLSEQILIINSDGYFEIEEEVL